MQRAGAGVSVQMDKCWASGKAYKKCIHKILSVVGLGVDSLAEAMHDDIRPDGKMCITRGPSATFQTFSCNETDTPPRKKRNEGCTSVRSRNRRLHPRPRLSRVHCARGFAACSFAQHTRATQTLDACNGGRKRIGYDIRGTRS